MVGQLLSEYGVGKLACVDNNETELFFLEQRLHGFGNANFILSDIRDRIQLSVLMEDFDVVFHAAAFKHVTLCERAPFEAIQTNVIGLQNVIWAALKNNIGIVIFTSSDKAVNPTSVMGTSKLMGERLMTAASGNAARNRTIFASTRFGNVVGSRGSVIPLFREQIRRGGPVTVTHSGMTRFIMSIQESVRLVVDSATLACGGEVFVTKMPAIRIADLAEVMIRELAPMYGHDPDHIRIETIGVKPGEKMYEELMTDEETRRTIELPSYYAILPAFGSLYRNIDYTYPDVVAREVNNPFNSGNQAVLSQEELRQILVQNDILEDNYAKEYRPVRILWPDDNKE